MRNAVSRYLRRSLPVMLCMLLAVSVVLTVSTVRMIREEIFEKQLSIAHQIKENLDYRFFQHEEFAEGIMVSILPYLNGEASSSSQQYSEYIGISNQLAAHIGKGMICDIKLFVSDEKMYSRQKDMFYPLSELKSNGYDPAELTPGIHWLETETIRVSVQEETQAIACVQASRKRSDFSELGSVLVLYLPVNSLNEIFEVSPSLTGDVFLVNAEGVGIAHPNTDYIGIQLLTEEELDFMKSSDSGCKTVGKNLLAYSTLEAVPWYLVVRRPMLSSGEISPIGLIMLVTLWVLTFLLVGFVIIMYMNNSIVGNAILTLQAMIEKVQFSNDPVHIAKEIPDRSWLSNTRLQSEMEQTVQAMAKTIEKRYEERLELADYQMQSLQSQIKPHFLYNTLDVIKWLVVEGNYTDSIWTINALSRYLRMSINRESNIVTVADEVELAKTYLDILQRRYQGKFSISFDLEEAAMSRLLPRLILQPIVENALLHGLLGCEKSDLKLVIRAWVEENSLCIDIEDNGSGMDEQTLRSLETDRKPTTGSYGLKNVRTRLNIFGGNSASMHLYSQPGIGTCVSLRIPSQIKDLPQQENMSHTGSP